MIMIAEKAMGVKSPIVTYAGVEQAILKRLLGLLLGKDMGSVITAIQYVVDSAWILNSQASSHK
jgi:hypothetical protein